MKRMMQGMIALMMAAALSPAARAAEEDAGAVMANAVSQYVGTVMGGLREVAERQPTAGSFRGEMKAFVDKTPGLFGASLIDTNFVIRAVYHKRDFLAVGYDLKKVKQLHVFWDLMREKPAAQLSEPGHGSLVQPRLVAFRYPVLENGRFKGIVSAMMHTDAVLKAVGLDKCRAYRIYCRGTLAEEHGDLAGSYREITLDLPSTTWVIQFQN